MNITGYPGYDRTAAAALRLRNRLDQLTQQSSTGLKADTYGGLGGTDSRRSVSLRAEMARHESLVQGATRAGSRATMAQSVLGRLNDIAVEMHSSATSLLGATPANAAYVANQARSMLQEVVSLLNDRVDGEYLFNGSDTANPPVPGAANILSSPLVTNVRAQVATLTPTNGAAVAAAARTAAATEFDTSFFSAHLNDPATGGSEKRRSVPVEEGVSVDIGVFANRNAYETGSPVTTDPWALDLLHGLAVLASLDQVTDPSGAGFQTVVTSAMDSLESSVTKLAQEQGVLGAAQARLEESSAWHKDTLTALEIELAGVEEVDFAATWAALEATRTQLEASYQSLTMLNNVSLVNFLR